MINLRNALMTGKRLPYDAEVEYLESDGYAYAVAPNNIFSKHTGLRVELTLSTGSATLSAVSVLLAAGGDIQGPPYYYRVAIDKTTQFASPGVNWFSLFTDGDVHTVSTTNVNLTNTGIYSNTDVDGTRVLSGSYSSAKKTFDDTVGIFAFNNGNNKCPAGIRIYSIVAFDENGNKTADFIPVRVGTVGYLYDRVSGALFGNAGTGDFVLGPDVVPVEYIESHGTEYIDTGVGYYADFEIKVKMRTSLSNITLYSGGYNRLERISARLPYWRFRSNAGGTYDSTIPITELHTLAWRNGKIYSDGAEIYQLSKPYQNYEMYVFGTDTSAFPCVIYYLDLWDSTDTPVRKFRPVRVGTDATTWEGAMMDVLTRRIYRNQGTGAFTYGNDLKYPIPAE